MKQLIAKFLKDERGASLVEYILIAAIVGIGAIVGLQALQAGADTKLKDVGTKVGNAAP